MKKITIVLIAVIIVGCSPSEDAPQKTQNNTGKSEYLLLSTFWFQKSAEQEALYHQAYNIAKMRAGQIAKKAHDKPQAVVLDIDETVLDNAPYQGWCIKNDSTFSKKSWHRWVLKTKAKALAGAIDFTKFAKNQGLEIFYISNRHVSELDATIKNLKAEGFPNANKKFILLKDSTSNKTYRRNQVQKTHEIALLIGDNLGDFDHLYDKRTNQHAHKVVEKQKDLFGKKFIMLPNPMYGKWERPYQNMSGDYVENLKGAIKSF